MSSEGIKPDPFYPSAIDRAKFWENHGYVAGSDEVLALHGLEKVLPQQPERVELPHQTAA